MNDLQLSKTISYALRHNPKKYNLSPNKEGYVLISDLLKGLSEQLNFPIDIDDIKRIMLNSDKKRYEILDNMIRATYGHSKVRILKNKVKPPKVLYHGTTSNAWKYIAKTGLKSMGRQFVHLSEDVKTATVVARRRTNNPIIVVIEAKRAFEDGLAFYKGNDTTWLSANIDKRYLKILSNK